MNPLHDASTAALGSAWQVETPLPRPSTSPKEALSDRASRSLQAAARCLLKKQHSDGHWRASLDGGPSLASQTLLLETWLGNKRSLSTERIARGLIERCLETGGWSAYDGGPFDLTTSVQAYMALKAVGVDSDADTLLRARTAIRAAGGAEQADGQTRFFLALLGQMDYDHCLEIPPSVMLLPLWVPFHPCNMSAWVRTMAVPLSVVSACRPVRKLADARGVAELFCSSETEWPQIAPLSESTTEDPYRSDLFHRLDPYFKWLRHRRFHPLRQSGLDAAKKWITEHLVDSDGPGGNAHALIVSTVALRCLGFGKRSTEMQYCREQLDALVVESTELAEEETKHEAVAIQPVATPVADTSLALTSLCAAGFVSEERPLRRSVRWLLDREIRRPGDWAASVDTDPGGWSCENHNAFYPHMSATAGAMLALRAHVGDMTSTASPLEEKDIGSSAMKDDSRIIAAAKAINLDSARRYVALLDRSTVACERARLWLLSMQNQDGGWGAFDHRAHRRSSLVSPLLSAKAADDSSAPDVTGSVLEAFGQWGERVGHAPVDRGIAYLRATQCDDGSWASRWGVGYIHGTWRGLTGLAAVGLNKKDPALTRGAEWLASTQLASGGWGESPRCINDPACKGSGPATATQTAWALLALLAAGQGAGDVAQRGIDFLLRTQNREGRWSDTSCHVVATWPGSFVRNDLYPIAYPILALATWKRVTSTR